MLHECVRALWRRRLLSSLGVLLSLCAAAAVFVVVKPMYMSTAQVLFVPSVRQPGVDVPTNPFLSFGGSVSIVASIVQTQVSDDRTAASLERSGRTAKYLVTPNLAENAGPILLVEVSDTSTSNTRATLAAVLGAIRTNLRTLQEDQAVPAAYLVTSVVLTSSKKPEVDRSTQVKAAIVVFVAAMALSTALILLLERRRIRATIRKSRGRQRSRPRAPGGPRQVRSPEPNAPAPPSRREAGNPSLS